ncbi:MAG: TrmH family RNA methyltransferase [Chlamydiia bacterium]|nr:TrmH family RNA methyltransferase [Chlamydiia bacterium]
MFTKRKFLQLDLKQKHKKCAELLRKYFGQTSWSTEEREAYNALLSWMKLLPFSITDKKQLADRYHWHLQQASLSLKEHNLLPRLRTGDRPIGAEFLPIAIYLDGIRSAYNVGSILRTCEAMRIGKVYFSERTPYLDNEKVQRTAMGAADLVPCAKAISLDELPKPILVLDTSDQAISLHEFVFPQQFTLVLGNEEYGVSEALMQKADHILEIPLCGVKNSLNVACAFAIAASAIRSSALCES